MKTCRICLVMDVKMFRLERVEVKDLIEGIFKQNGFDRNLSINNYTCYECKYLLMKTYNFVQRTLRAQRVLQNMIQDKEKVTMQELLKLNRHELRLNTNLKYMKNQIDYHINEEECDNELKLEDFDIKKTKVECLDNADDIDICNAVKDTEEDYSIEIKAEEFIDPLINRTEIMFETPGESNYKTDYDATYNEQQINNNIKTIVKKTKKKFATEIKIESMDDESTTSKCNGNNLKRVKKKDSERKVIRKIVSVDEGDYEPASTDSLYNKFKPKIKCITKPPEREYPRKCDHCSYDVPTRKDHYPHYLFCHPNKKYPYHLKSVYVCQFCGKTKNTKAHHIAHELTHGEKNLQCPECPKRFHNLKQLNRHRSNCHIRSRVLICDFCGKQCSARHDLVLHIRTHTGEKPYKCHICGAGFAHIGNRGIHIRTNHQNLGMAVSKHKEGQRRRKKKPL